MLWMRHYRHSVKARRYALLLVFLLIIGLGILWKLSDTVDVTVQEISTTTPVNTQLNIVPGSNSNFAFQPGPEPPTEAPPLEYTTADAPQTEEACQTEEGQWQWISSACIPADQTTCVQHGGLWGPSGNRIPAGCSLRAEDGGRECTDSNQCLGRCIVREGDIVQGERTDDDQSNVTGHCTERVRVSGCLTELRDGTIAVYCDE